MSYSNHDAGAMTLKESEAHKFGRIKTLQPVVCNIRRGNVHGWRSTA